MKALRRVLPLFLLMMAFSFVSWAEDEIDPFDAAENARRAHEKAASDMIYQQEEWKALYYQNQQIIQLLKDIHETLNVIKARSATKTEGEA